ncbi:hypothetical protein L6494_01180 [Nostoc sp. UHCC 0870]|uniref:hypothetical protein n=1 Tax=Nostoc sp. UHCC 0870 TaxID=2914041 RepID=UPI001EDED240|nr:hypothetical protein [Nostoc sp. UHCC 0870]UKO98390.1 hypothetical protein L6494_01180 [Nostoc sp. UHCC 0870]
MLKVTIDATPITLEQTGVGFYVLNLIDALFQLQSSEQFQLSIVYQPRFKKLVKG